MSGSKPKDSHRAKHFTAFYSAAEESAARSDEESWANERGHMSSEKGRIVHTPGSDLPYKVILDAGEDTGRAFATMKDAEAFIQTQHTNTGSPPHDL